MQNSNAKGITLENFALSCGVNIFIIILSLSFSLRKLYLKLLLLHPNCKESKDSETHMWMQTSYQFISVYKQRLAALDSKLFSQNGQGSKQKNTKDSSGHVEYRRLLSRFRQFLAEEEKFFVRLLIRFRTQFALDEALAQIHGNW